MANRKIAGMYKFSDGGEVGYVGAYEKKFLEFMDKIMKINSEDLQEPGPDIAYQYNGENHLYIPDYYYIPYNLIIEIKRGGEKNPDIYEYKEKTVAKEEAVRKLNKYNYLRLTNNDFSQVMSIFGLLKYDFDEKSNDKIMRIYESTLYDDKSDVDIVNELFTKNIKSFDDISESELGALYRLSGISGDGSLNEIAIEDSDENFNKDPLYVILMDLNMMRNKVIKAFTKSPFSHSAISFDASLNDMYSFANERDDEGNVLRTGFTPERKSTYLNINKNCKCKVFALFVNNRQMINVKNLVEYYKNNITKTAYNMFSILGIVVNKNLKRATNDPLKMICSQFVYTILMAAEIHSNINKDASHVTPGDLNTKLDDKRLFTVFDGLLRDYNENTTLKKVRQDFKSMNKPTNETTMSGTIDAALAPSPLPSFADKNNYYIIQHMKNNVYDYSITKDPMQYSMFSIDPEKGYKVYKSDKGKIEKTYLTFKMKDSKKAKEVYDEVVDMYNHEKCADCSDYIYYKYTGGNHILDENQLMFDDRFELIKNFFEGIQSMEEALYEYLTPSKLDILEEKVDELGGIIYGRNK